MPYAAQSVAALSIITASRTRPKMLAIFKAKRVLKNGACVPGSISGQTGPAPEPANARGRIKRQTGLYLRRRGSRRARGRQRRAARGGAGSGFARFRLGSVPKGACAGRADPARHGRRRDSWADPVPGHAARMAARAADWPYGGLPHPKVLNTNAFQYGRLDYSRSQGRHRHTAPE